MNHNNAHLVLEAFRNNQNLHLSIKKYLLNLFLNPDKGSEFEKKTASFRWLIRFLKAFVPTEMVFLFMSARMYRMNYQGLLLLDETGKLKSLVFFEKKSDNWHVFFTFTPEPLRGKGFATHLLIEYLKLAKKFKVMDHYLGSDGSDGMYALVLKLVKKGLILPLVDENEDDGRVKINPGYKFS